MSAEDVEHRTLERQHQFTEAADAVLKQPFAFHCRLQIEFELMPTAV
jgi:hypothetical protein